MSNAVPSSSQVPSFPSHARVAIVAARFNADIVDELVSGCRNRLTELGAAPGQVELYRVPGAFELPLMAMHVALTEQYAAIICLGAVVRGDTPHFDYVAGEAARGIANVSMTTTLPCIFGVLTTNTRQQALDRIDPAGPHGHAGVRAAEAAVEMMFEITQVWIDTSGTKPPTRKRATRRKD